VDTFGCGHESCVFVVGCFIVCLGARCGWRSGWAALLVLLRFLSVWRALRDRKLVRQTLQCGAMSDDGLEASTIVTNLERKLDDLVTLWVQARFCPGFFDNVEAVIAIPSLHMSGFARGWHLLLDHLPRCWSVDGRELEAANDANGLPGLGRDLQRLVHRIIKGLVRRLRSSA